MESLHSSKIGESDIWIKLTIKMFLFRLNAETLKQLQSKENLRMREDVSMSRRLGTVSASNNKNIDVLDIMKSIQGEIKVSRLNLQF